MSRDYLKVTVTDAIAVVQIDRPPVNAQNIQLRDEFVSVFDEMSEREDVRVVILTGTGKVFCAGADIKELLELEETPGNYTDMMRKVRELDNSVRECTKPVIAAVNGLALGGGFSLAAACDIMIASENASFSLPEINVGIPGGGSVLHRLGLSGSIGRRLLYTGARISGPELARLGAIDECVRADSLMDEAMKLARELAQKSPLALYYAKQAYAVVEEMPFRDAFRHEQGLTYRLRDAADTREARQAFFEKRPPVFVGR